MSLKSAACGPKSRVVQPQWRVLVCVLLIGLILYNPFAALSGSSGHLSYEKLTRNRASIGSSELQHFSPVSNPQIENKVNIEVPNAGTVPVPQQKERPADREVLLPSEPAFYAEVWFRPPPSL